MTTQTGNVGMLPEGEGLRKNVATRRIMGKVWQWLFFSSMIIAMVALAVLLLTIVNKAFGYTAIIYKVEPATLIDTPVADLTKQDLLVLLEQELRKGVYTRLNTEKPLEDRSRAELFALVQERGFQEKIAASWTLEQSLFERAAIDAEVAEKYPDAHVTFRSWISLNFLSMPISSQPIIAGVRTALMGSLWMIMITILLAFPIGVGAAIYLEEYATDNWINRIIQTNINNLAGVPSIIYGMLGLAIFVRVMEPLTSGALFLGAANATANGRTILAAGLTMALLVLPIIIINAQEAIRSVPNSLRQASYGLGATRWQTIWNHVLPVAMPGVLTGTILAVSRAIGETAPLIVVGASTFIATDPNGPFSKFTALPIIIYNWTSRPQDEFRNIAAAAIIVLLVLLLSLNSVAIVLRNHFRRSL